MLFARSILSPLRGFTCLWGWRTEASRPRLQFFAPLRGLLFGYAMVKPQPKFLHNPRLRSRSATRHAPRLQAHHSNFRVFPTMCRAFSSAADSASWRVLASALSSVAPGSKLSTVQMNLSPSLYEVTRSLQSTARPTRVL